MLPKIHSVDDLEIVTDAMEAFGRAKGTINFVASIESAKALYNIGTIAAWRSVYGPEKGGKLMALLVIPLIPLAVATECFTMIRSPSLGQRIVRFPSQSFQGVGLTRTFLDCADSSVIRTSSRQELLYPRSKIAVVAKAFGLGAIDMVCDFSS